MKTIVDNMVPPVEALSAGDISTGVTQLANIPPATEAMLSVIMSSLYKEASSDVVEVLRQKCNHDLRYFWLTKFREQLCSR